ncbi:hypothetical protein A4U53_028105 [Rhizobium ruizarguesonis]|uniref:Uncharacterized protein n=1 Tax=Rhizobium ruizarguesonis TaxID=2081791 RepID=A0ACD5EV37_9HYPH
MKLREKEAGHANEIEITDELIEAGLGSPNSTIRGRKLPKEMFPAAIRSILVVTRVVRERHPELPQFVVSEDESSRFPSCSQLGIGERQSEILQAVHLARGAVGQEQHRYRDDIEPDSAGA